MSQQFSEKYVLPVVKTIFGCGLIFLAQKAHISSNPLLQGSKTIDFLIGISRFFGIVSIADGLAQITLL